MKRIFIISGELSGDIHGAGLMQEIIRQEPGTKFLGLGGPQMASIPGAVIEDWVASAAVVGISEVIQRYGFFKQRLAACIEAIEVERPDAVILIDYTGFNLRIAKAIRARKLATRTIYFISPQVWAWKKGRIKEMAQTLDLMICIFPFEPPLYEASGLRAVFAGHPMVDRVKTLTRPWARESKLVGWFPGSREDEIRRLFPVMIKAALLIKKQVPDARFAVSAANEVLAGRMRDIADEIGVPEAKRWIETGTVYDLMQRCQVGAVASGTATLEAACFGLPYALIYKVSWPTYLIAKLVIRIKNLGIINILAGRNVVPELLQHQCNPKTLASTLCDWLASPEKREAQQREMAATVALLGGGGAYDRAAQHALNAMNA